MIGRKITKVLIKGWWSILAVVGGGLWTTKSLAIMMTSNQPDYLFELAPSALAAAAFGLALVGYREHAGSRLPIGLGILAITTSGVASVSYVVRGDDEGLFGPALMITILSLIVILFWVGRPLWRIREDEQWRAIPYPLAWSSVVVIPLGGLLSIINEQLLEIPLLAISIGWIWLGVAFLASTSRVESKAG